MRLKNVYIAVKNPLYKGESKIQLTKEAQANIEKESLDKLDKLEVAEVGSDVKTTKAGDFIFVDINKIAHAPRVIVDNVSYIFLREADIIFIY